MYQFWHTVCVCVCVLVNVLDVPILFIFEMLNRFYKPETTLLTKSIFKRIFFRLYNSFFVDIRLAMLILCSLKICIQGYQKVFPTLQINKVITKKTKLLKI